MRTIPIAKLFCEKCGKEIELFDDDFFVELDPSEREWHKYFYVCPKCGETGAHPSCFVPTYLKDRLVAEKKKEIALSKKTRIPKVPMIFGIVIVSIFIVVSQ